MLPGPKEELGGVVIKVCLVNLELKEKEGYLEMEVLVVEELPELVEDLEGLVKKEILDFQDLMDLKVQEDVLVPKGNKDYKVCSMTYYC